MPLYTPGMIWASGALHSYSFVFIADAIFYLLETLENKNFVDSSDFVFQI